MGIKRLVAVAVGSTVLALGSAGVASAAPGKIGSGSAATSALSPDHRPAKTCQRLADRVQKVQERKTKLTERVTKLNEALAKAESAGKTRAIARIQKRLDNVNARIAHITTMLQKFDARCGSNSTTPAT